MKSYILQTLMLFGCLSQVACSGGGGGGANQAMVLAALSKHCNHQQPCIDMYKNAAKNVAIVGTAAANGLPQIADPGAKVVGGQVPDPTVLPASVVGVTEAQVKAQAAQIQAALNEWTGGALGVSSAKPASSGGAIGGSLEKVEIGVLRLPDDIAPAFMEADSAADRGPAAVPPQAPPSSSEDAGPLSAAR